MGWVPSRGLGVAVAVGTVDEMGRRRRLIVVLGVWHHAGDLLLLVLVGGGAARVVGALGLVVGLPRGRLPLHRPGVLGGHGVLLGVGRGGRQGLHGRVSLGGGRGLLRGMQAGGPTAARLLMLVMRPHGVFDAGVRIVDVLHGDVAADVSTLRGGVEGREGGGQRRRVLGGGGGVMIVAVGGGGWRLCVLELREVGLGRSLSLSLTDARGRVRRGLGQRWVIPITGRVAARARQVEPLRGVTVRLPLRVHGSWERNLLDRSAGLPLVELSWDLGPRGARVANLARNGRAGRGGSGDDESNAQRAFRRTDETKWLDEG